MDLESDDEYMRSICDMMNLNEDDAGNGFSFNIDFVVAQAGAPSKNQYADTGSIKTFRSACHDDASLISSDSNPDSDRKLQSSKTRSSSPDSITIDTDTETQATSTLTEDPPSNIEASLEHLMLHNPGLVKKVLQKNSQFSGSSKSYPVSPSQGADGS
jgi:hypothetical protein